MNILKTTIFIYILSVTNAIANNDDFKCIVKEAQHVNKNGNIEPVKLWNFYVEKEFTVERATGIVAGEQFKNNIAGIKPLVYNDEHNNYSVVSISGGDNVINYLQINKFEKYKRKPFIYIMTNVVLSGICNYY